MAHQGNLQKVSVVVMTYNRKPLLEQCLHSLLHQDYLQDRYELIVVDDGSSDGTSEMLYDLSKKNNNLVIVRHLENKGIAAARNSGIRKATGRYIGFVADDYIMPRNYVKSIAYFFRKYQKADVIKFRIENYEPHNKISYYAFCLFDYYINALYCHIQRREHLLKLMNIHSIIPPADAEFRSQDLNAGVCAYRKHVLMNVGFFNENIKRGEDAEYAL